MPSEKSLKRMDKLVESFTKKSGTWTHPDEVVTDAVVQGLANLSFVIINRRQNCGLVRPEDEEESKIDARETVPPSRRLRT